MAHSAAGLRRPCTCREPSYGRVRECFKNQVINFSSFLLNLLEEALQVRGLVVEELNLFLALLAFDFASRGVARLDSLDLALKFDDLV